MTAAVTDERQLPAMYMVWPIDRLPAAPVVALPGEYLLHGRMTALKPLFAGNAPGNRWLHFRGATRRFSIKNGLLPDGAFDEDCKVLSKRVAAARGSRSLL